MLESHKSSKNKSLHVIGPECERIITTDGTFLVVVVHSSSRLYFWLYAKFVIHFFSETTKENGEKKKVFSGRKRRQSATDGLAKIDKCLEEFMSYQQEADRRFLMAEEAREKKEQERDEKRRKEDQEFFIKLMQVLKK